MTRAKMLSIAAVLALSLPLTACGGDDEKKGSDARSTSSSNSNPFGGGSSTPTESTETPEPTETTDEPTETATGEPTETSGDDFPGREEAVTTLAQHIKSSANGQFDITDQEATCASEAVVDGLGSDRLMELGLAKESGTGSLALSEDEAGNMADAMIQCGAISADKMKKTVKDQMGTAAAEVKGMDACLDEAITDDFIRTLFVAGITGADTTSTTSELQTSLMTCIGDAQG